MGKNFLVIRAALLARTWPSARALARASELNPCTVQRLLVKAASVGLVQKMADGGWQLGPNDMDTAAQLLGTWGTGERQRQRHHQERVAYAREREQRNARPRLRLRDG